MTNVLQRISQLRALRAPLLSEIRRVATRRLARISYRVQIMASINEIQVSAAGVDIVNTIQEPIFTLSRIPLDQTPSIATIRREARNHITTLTANFYRRVRIVPSGENPATDLTPGGLYYGYSDTLPDRTELRVFLVRGSGISESLSDFMNLRMRNADECKLYSMGLNSDWNNKKGYCVANALLHQFKGLPRFKNLTRDSIFDTLDEVNPFFDTDNMTVKDVLTFCKLKDVSCYVVGVGNRLRAKYISKNKKSPSFYFKVANDHIYPIDCEELKKQIRYNGVTITTDIDWSKSKKVILEESDLESILEKIQELNAGGHPPLTPQDLTGGTSANEGRAPALFIKKCFSRGSSNCFHSNLNELAKHIYDNTGIMPENIKTDKQGNIISFSHLSVWVFFNPEVEVIMKILDVVRELSIIKNKQDFMFKNQPIQSITQNLIRAYRGELPKSDLNTNTFKTLTSSAPPRGAYNEVLRGIYTDHHLYKTFDIKRCHTSILYNRTHDFGIFKPWDVPREYLGGLVEGAKYYISTNFKLGELKMNAGYFDSEFVSLLLDNDIIERKVITQEIIPSYVIPASYFHDIFEIIYKTIPEHAKDLINKFIGTLGKTMSRSSATCELSTSAEHMNNWISANTESNHAKALSNSLFILFNRKETLNIETNLPIYQGIIDMSYWYLYQLCKTVCSPQSEVISFHSDSVTVKNPKPSKYVIGTFIGSSNPLGLGSIRSEVLDVNNVVNIRSFSISSARLVSPKRKFIQKDQECIEELIKNNKGFGLIGKPGTGKSYTTGGTIKNALKKHGKRYIACSTSWKAVDNLREHGTSGLVMASLFFPKPGQSLMGKIEELAKSVEYILVDEYTMTSLKSMELFYMLHKRGVKIIFIGDFRQIPPINGKNEIRLKYMESEFFHEMCDYQFIELTKNCRFDKELGRLCDSVYEDGFFSLTAGGNPPLTPLPRTEPGESGAEPRRECDDIPDFDFDSMITESKREKELPIMEQPKGEYFKECRLNVCYTRKTRDAINNYFMKKNKKLSKKGLKGSNNSYFVKNSPILCKINKINDNLFNNRLFNLDSWTKKVVYLSDGEEKIAVDMEEFRGFNKKTKAYNFVPGHAFTDHSAQGSTLPGDVCIWESQKMSRNLLYTALSRATSKKHIFIHNYRELTNIREEQFNEPGDFTVELDITKRAFRGSIYELYDKKNDKPFYVGSTSRTLNEREAEHREVVASYEEGEEDNFTQMYQFVIKNKIKFSIREVSKVYYDVDSELRAEEYRVIQQYVINGEDLKNTNLSNVRKPRRLKRGSYKKKKDSKLSGCIYKMKDRIRFRYSVKGKRKYKNFKFTKKRTPEQAMAMALDFQKEINK